MISTGIDNENYYKNILQNENNSKFQQVEMEHNFTEKSDSFNGEESNNDKQESFFVDLQETSIKKQTSGSQNQENKAIKIHKKRSLFSKIFGLKEKTENKHSIHEVKNEEQTDEMEFKNQMKEVIEENLNKSTNMGQDEFQAEKSSNDDVKILESKQIDDNISELEVKKSKTELDDDLLQIPAFLRRQAN